MNIPTRRRILLTGTPVQNDLQEFFAIVEFCNPGVLGKILPLREYNRKWPETFECSRLVVKFSPIVRGTHFAFATKGLFAGQ